MTTACDSSHFLAGSRINPGGTNEDSDPGQMDVIKQLCISPCLPVFSSFHHGSCEKGLFDRPHKKSGNPPTLCLYPPALSEAISTPAED